MADLALNSSVFLSKTGSLG